MEWSVDVLRTSVLSQKHTFKVEYVKVGRIGIEEQIFITA
jgi:hypothetical protein